MQESATVASIAPGLPNLRGKVAFITGASSGIGKACATALFKAGMKVVACARRLDRLVELEERLCAEASSDAEFLAVQCDVQDEADIVDAMSALENAYGRGPAVVVNNAGLSREDTSILAGNTRSWAEMMGTNVTAVAIVTREAVKLMRRHDESGHIVNVSSLSAYRIPRFEGGAFYAATKHALRCISDGTRMEAQQQQIPLRVTCISPGVVDTEFYHVRHRGEPVKSVNAYDYQALHTDNIVQALMYAIGAPAHVNVDDVIVRSVGQTG